MGEQARADGKPDRGVPGAKAGKTPGVPETLPPEPGELQQTPQEIEGPYFRLGAPMRSNLLEPGDTPGIDQIAAEHALHVVVANADDVI